MENVISIKTYREALDWHQRVLERIAPGRYTVRETVEDFNAFEQPILYAQKEHQDSRLQGQS